jgi:uncharacterized protein
MTPLAPTPLGTRLALRIQPRASRNAIVGLHGQSVRIRLTAPPVDGAAAVDLVRGHASRDKVVEVTGLAPEEVARRLGL